MNSLITQSVISILAGIFIFVKPELLSYIVGIYLLVVGIVGLAQVFM
ncbi:MAG: DUF3096 domain-containing protein [Rhodospirillales bacterium]|nr:DUF3096 domain-containing protein [Rhodospirillales bacterium]